MAFIPRVVGEDGRTGQQRLAVRSGTVGQWSLRGAPGLVHRVGSVVHGSAQLLKGPGEQARAVRHHMADPAGAVLTGQLPVAVGGLVQGFLALGRPEDPCRAPDVSPVVLQGVSKFVDEVGRLNEGWGWHW